MPPGTGLPCPGQHGWYKRRLPVLSPLPGGSSGSQGLGTSGPPPAPWVIRRDAQRRGATYKSQPLLMNPPGPVPGGVIPAHVFRRDYERGGLVYRLAPFLKTPPAPVAGGVLPPWVLRRDYARGGLVYRDRPFLKAPPPPVPGMVPRPMVVRWGRERSALVFWETVPYSPPPVFLDGTTWISWHSQTRGVIWFAEKRGLIWEPDVTNFLTKHSAETRQYSMDFSELPELANGSLSSVSSVTSNVLTVDASNVTLANPAVGSNGKMATVWISGGQSGASYQIAFVVTLAGGTVLEEFGYLLVEDE